ncbi:MAG TPA: exodeoxyribonuclease V subunit alpha, partial [Marmoricola sp.]|nr:exodeoxyribonuclease V subunit alpha [Marmoricola sp.]
MTEVFEPVDAHDRRLVLGATGLLAQFNAAGVLQAADVHVASRIGALAGERREEVHLALAMLVRAARNGSVCLEFESLEPPPEPLAWPSDWLALVADSPLVPAGVIRIDEGLAYLDRYWREEGAVSADL